MSVRPFTTMSLTLCKWGPHLITVSLCAGHGSFPPIDCVPDTVNGVRFVRDLYEMSNDTSGTAAISCSPEALKDSQRCCT